MTSVFLVDDHRIFLSGVRSELEGRFEIAGSASYFDEAVEESRSRKVLSGIRTSSAHSTDEAVTSQQLSSGRSSSVSPRVIPLLR